MTTSKKGPDHSLINAKIQTKGEEPEVYAVMDLKAFVKPGLDEELTSIKGDAAAYGTEMICECVPVEDCVCNTVSEYSGNNPCPSDCDCVGDGCVGLYWHPY